MAFQKKAEQPSKSPVVQLLPPKTEKERESRIADLVAELNKKNETTNSLVLMGDKKFHLLPSINTGLPSFDYTVIQTGGIPRGRIIEIYGPESAGKTTATLHIIAEEQRQGGNAAFVDAEHALDPNYARQLGVDIDNLLISQPDNGEAALETVKALITSRLVTLVVVDSVSALVPKAELAGDIGDQHPGLQARLMSQAMRILAGLAQTNNVTVIFINQIREKIGVMFGNPETTSGGRALKFSASVRIDVRRREPIVYGPNKDIVGHWLELEAKKNKCGIPFRTTKIALYYPNTPFPAGFDKAGDMVQFAAEKGLIEMRGSWYWLDLGNVDDKKKPIGPERIANGIVNMRDAIRENPKIVEVLSKKIAALTGTIAAVPQEA